MQFRWPNSDRYDFAVLHDALKLRLQFGDDADIYCGDLIEYGAADPEKKAELRKLRHALELLPGSVPTYGPEDRE